MSRIHSSDLMGQAIMDFWRTGVDKPIDVWINGQPDEQMWSSVFFRSFNRMKAWDRHALSLARGSILDVGAGAGSHSLLLQKRGHDVLALELSAQACRVMEERGVHRVMNDDIFNLRGIPFNTILLLMNGLGIAGTEKETLKLFRLLKLLLAKGGQILGDSTDIFYTSMDSSKRFPQKGSYYGEVEFELAYAAQRSVPFNWLYMDPALLAELSDKAGLYCQIIYRSDNFHYLAQLTASSSV